MEEAYQKINSSFKDKLVYHLGSEAGFFSEYNNMILAMLYCLKHKIKFELYSQDANFAYSKGWQDYFLPYCTESDDNRHSKFNPRQPIDNFSLSQRIKIFWFKTSTRSTYLSSDLWCKFHTTDFEKEVFDIKALNINGSTQEAVKPLIELTWRYNRATEIEVQEMISSCQLPDDFIGLHIRGGDKFLEYKTVELNNYMLAVQKNSSLKDIFILTDDFRVIRELRKNYPDYRFYSLCGEAETGYYHIDFTSSNIAEKRFNMVKLFASMDILSESKVFVGTFSSNPGMFLGMKMKAEKVKGVDLEKWTIW